MRRVYQVLAAATCVSLFTTGAARADLLVDRGLPSTGVNANVGGDWSPRSNITWADYDPKDPAGVPPLLAGDDFTMPSANSTYSVSDIRVWVVGYGSMPFSSMYNSISLMFGSPSDLTQTFTNPTVSAGAYGDGQTTYVGSGGGQDLIWQLDFAVNLTLNGATKYGFAIDPDGKAIPGGPGSNGETYYIAFPSDTKTSLLSPASGPDGLITDYNTDGTFADSADSGQFWIWSSDMNVQVFGTPEPATFTLLATAMVGLGVFGVRRKRSANG